MGAEAAALPILGGILGNVLSSSDRNAATQVDKDSLQRWLDLNVPDPASQQVIMQQYQMTGKLDPAMEQAVQQQASGMADVNQSAATKDAQMNALSGLQDISNRGGLGIQDKANLATTQISNAADDAGRRGAIAQSMAARGMNGSGMALLQQLQSAQDATTNNAASGLTIAGQAQQRALDALSQGGTLAGSIGAQQFSQDAQKAQAQDAINQFNAQNSQGVNTRNTDRDNTAQTYNVSTAQDIANNNADLTNQQNLYNKGLIQQQYDNTTAKLNGAQGAANTLSNQYQNNANQTAASYANMGAGAGQMYQGYNKKNTTSGT